jgi:hypothetical protein
MRLATGGTHVHPRHRKIAAEEPEPVAPTDGVADLDERRRRLGGASPHPGYRA